MRALLTADGLPLEETPAVYDQAFLLFALAGVFAATGEAGLEGKAAAVRDLLAQDADAIGGLKEAGTHPYQSNAHMHLLEAALAWEQSGGDASWSALADQLVLLARTRFIDPETGSLREFFDANWAPAPGEDGRLIEPGHQFEWAWLMARYGRRRIHRVDLKADSLTAKPLRCDKGGPRAKERVEHDVLGLGAVHEGICDQLDRFLRRVFTVSLLVERWR
jgi:mannose/cellobiose epimerase-like protein (N-acyl-D-glucosamine 2-epimerase family)